MGKMKPCHTVPSTSASPLSSGLCVRASSPISAFSHGPLLSSLLPLLPVSTFRAGGCGGLIFCEPPALLAERREPWAGSLRFLLCPLRSRCRSPALGPQEMGSDAGEGRGGVRQPPFLCHSSLVETSWNPGSHHQRGKKLRLIRHNSVVTEESGNTSRILLLLFISPVICSKVLHSFAFQFPPLLRSHAAQMR